MSVIIKGMKMPKNCWECCLTSENEDFDRCCLFTGVICLSIGRQDNCPLVEIPTPHGKLIDADAIDYRNDVMHDGKGNLIVEDNFISGVMWINDCINETKAIIEEEKNEVVS